MKLFEGFFLLELWIMFCSMFNRWFFLLSFVWFCFQRINGNYVDLVVESACLALFI